MWRSIRRCSIAVMPVTRAPAGTDRMTTAPSETCGPGWERADRFEPEQPGEEPPVAHRPPRDPVVRFFEKLFRVRR